jgi:hypothetical protein
MQSANWRKSTATIARISNVVFRAIITTLKLLDVRVKEWDAAFRQWLQWILRSGEWADLRKGGAGEAGD